MLFRAPPLPIRSSLRRLSLLVFMTGALWVASVRGEAQDAAGAVLLIPASSCPSTVRRPLTTLFANHGPLSDYSAYRALARERNLRPSSRRALERIATQRGAQLIVVASCGGHFRQRVLRMRYYSGSTGSLILSRSHTLRGQNLRGGSTAVIQRDLERALNQPSVDAASSENDSTPPTTGDAGGLPPPIGWNESPGAAGGESDLPPPLEEELTEAPSDESEPVEPPLEEQRQWGFAVSAGTGIMNRTATVPTVAGPATLSTLPYPAIQAEALTYGRPDPSSRFRLEFAARYTTSVGLVAEDQRADMTTRSTDLRTHHLRLALGAWIPLAPGDRPTFLLLELGAQFRILDAEIAVSIPDYALGGLIARVGLFFTIGDSPISIGLVPLIGHVANLSDELAETSEVSDGFVVGAELVVRAQIIPEVAIVLMYREAQAFLASTLDDDFADAERYGIVRAEYRF